MGLDAERGDIDAGVGGEGLGNRGEQRCALGPMAGLVAVSVVAHVGGVGADIADGARALGQRFHRHQHAGDIRMLDDRRHAGAGPTGGFALRAVLGVLHGLLGGGFADGDALHADGETGIVHHGEHAGEALVLLADQPADGTGFVAILAVAIDHGAGRRAVDAELVLQRMAVEVVASADRAIVVHKVLGHEEERDAACAGGCIGKTRENEMDDVLGDLVFAPGDVDLLAEDAVGAVIAALGAGLHDAEVRAGMGLGEVHGAGPFAGDHFRQILRLQLLGAVGGDGIDGTHGERRSERKAHGAGIPHFECCDIEHMGQPLPAEIFGRRQ